MAFVALQLSIFTCGYDIHVHHMDTDTGMIAHHHDPMDGDQGQVDQVCQIHASHVFAEQQTFALKSTDSFPAEIQQAVALNTVSFIHRIEHPPRYLHS